jgi:hypothetical protein
MHGAQALQRARPHHAGAILPGSERDVLLIGSPSALQCYDVDRNRRAASGAQAAPRRAMPACRCMA